MFSVKDIQIEETRAQIACMLNELWHSRLPYIHWSNVVRNTHYVCYVFKWQQAVVGVAIWSSPVAQHRMKNGKTTLELRRLALSDVCPKNTASCVLSKMIKMIIAKFPDISLLVSYQDKEVHLGTIYKASNWQATAESLPPANPWGSHKRTRNNIQSTSPKVRWEYALG